MELVARQQWAEPLSRTTLVQIHRESGHEWRFLDANVLLVDQLYVLPILIVGGPWRGCGRGCRRCRGATSSGAGSGRSGCGCSRRRSGRGRGGLPHIADLEFDLVTAAVVGDLIAAHGSGTGAIHAPGKLTILWTFRLRGFRFEGQGSGRLIQFPDGGLLPQLGAIDEGGKQLLLGILLVKGGRVELDSWHHWLRIVAPGALLQNLILFAVRWQSGALCSQKQGMGTTAAGTFLTTLRGSRLFLFQLIDGPK